MEPKGSLPHSQQPAEGSVWFQGFHDWFVTWLRFYGEKLAQPSSWRTTPALPSTTWGHTMLWWQGPTYYGTLLSHHNIWYPTRVLPHLFVKIYLRICYICIHKNGSTLRFILGFYHSIKITSPSSVITVSVFLISTILMYPANQLTLLHGA